MTARHVQFPHTTLVFDVPTRVEHDPRSERRLAWEGYRGYTTTLTQL